VPVDYEIDTEQDVVVTRGHGRLTDDDLLGVQQRLRADPAFRPDMNELCDLRDVSEVEVTSRGLRLLAARNHFGAGSRRAFVVERPVLFGIARMLQALTDRHPDELRVQFDELRDARAWVGLGAGLNQRATP